MDGSPRVITVSSAVLHAMRGYAHELDRFLGAVHPACQLVRVEEQWERLADGGALRTTGADFILEAGKLDLEGAAAFTARALQRAKLARVSPPPGQPRLVPDTFQDGPRRLRAGLAEAEILDGKARVLRVEALASVGADYLCPFLPPRIAAGAQKRRLGQPSAARLTHLFEPGGQVPKKTVAEARYPLSEGRAVTLTMTGSRVQEEESP